VRPPPLVENELNEMKHKISHQDQSPLRDQPLPYKVWGASGIDAGALDQMNDAMRLPITASGALMPDAHIGYGLPIGGVLATYDSVIPYAVGVRHFLHDAYVGLRAESRLSWTSLLPHTPKPCKTRPISARARPTPPIPITRFWRHTTGMTRSSCAACARSVPIRSEPPAAEIISPSGAELELTESDTGIDLPPGRYLALLSHSGSRAVGFKIANQYLKLANGTARQPASWSKAARLALSHL